MGRPNSEITHSDKCYTAIKSQKCKACYDKYTAEYMRKYRAISKSKKKQENDMKIETRSRAAKVNPLLLEIMCNECRNNMCDKFVDLCKKCNKAYDALRKRLYRQKKRKLKSMQQSGTENVLNEIQNRIQIIDSEPTDVSNKNSNEKSNVIKRDNKPSEIEIITGEPTLVLNKKSNEKSNENQINKDNVEIITSEPTIVAKKV